MYEIFYMLEGSRWYMKHGDNAKAAGMTGVDNVNFVYSSAYANKIAAEHEIEHFDKHGRPLRKQRV